MCALEGVGGMKVVFGLKGIGQHKYLMCTKLFNKQCGLTGVTVGNIHTENKVEKSNKRMTYCI